MTQETLKRANNIQREIDSLDKVLKGNQLLVGFEELRNPMMSTFNSYTHYSLTHELETDIKKLLEDRKVALQKEFEELR